MKLREWRKGKDWTQVELAQALGCSQTTISTFERPVNAVPPSPEVMRRIYRLTGGRVQPNDFYDLPDDTRSAGALAKVA